MNYSDVRFSIKYFSFAVSLGSMVALSGCGGSQSQSESFNEGPSVEYIDEQQYSADVLNYTNAEWLFQSYFGDYGVPKEAMPRIEKLLKQLANGFAKEYATGEDVQSSIDVFNQYVSLMKLNGDFDHLFGTLSDEEPEYLQGLDARLAGLDNEPALPREISPEMQRSIEKSDQLLRERAEARLIEAAELGLPYVIDDGDVQYFTISQLMSKSGGGSGGGSESSFGNIDAAGWSEADVIYIDANWGISNHVGLVTGTNFTSKQVIDASPRNPNGGVFRHTTGLRNWADKCTSCSVVYGLYEPRWAPGDLARSLIVNYAAAHIGKPYTYNFLDRTSTSTFYCSKLVWQAYRYMGVSLDGHSSGEITPLHLLLNSSLQRFATYRR